VTNPVRASQPAVPPEKDKPSFHASTKDDRLAPGGTGDSEDPKGPDKPRASNPASVAVPEQGEALEEGPGPAEGRTDNRAGG
jgi:hypothetical protein